MEDMLTSVGSEDEESELARRIARELAMNDLGPRRHVGRSLETGRDASRSLVLFGEKGLVWAIGNR